MALYERILTLIPVDELHDSYNDVMKEEISLINRAVNDVSAEFAKLEEIRDAVIKLDNGSTGSRRASLVEVIDNTRESQRQLRKKLDTTLAGMMASGDKMSKKRKNDEERGDESRRTGDDDAKTSSNKRLKVEATKLKAEISVRSSSWVSEITYESCVKTVEEVTKLPVQEREQHIPGLLHKLTSITPRHKPHYQILILKHVILWAYLSMDPVSLLRDFQNFCEAMGKSIKEILGTNGEFGLLRLSGYLSDLLKEIDDQNVPKSTGEVSAASSKGIHLSTDLVVFRVNLMMLEERRKHIPEVISSLKEDMSRDNVEKASY